jgi:hypothetical protein
MSYGNKWCQDNDCSLQDKCLIYDNPYKVKICPCHICLVKVTCNGNRCQARWDIAEDIGYQKNFQTRI